MRVIALAAAAACALAVVTVPARAAARRVDIRAPRIAFSVNPLLLVARGGVRIEVPPLAIEADQAQYDLSTDRLVVSGNARVTGPGGELDGAAYALDVAHDTAALLQTDPMPRTLALGADNVNAVESPATPQTFAVADPLLAATYIRTSHAIVTPGANVRFEPARFHAAGRLVTSPGYVYVISSDPWFAQNPLPAATFDQPLAIAGTRYSLLSAHLRYDQVGGATLGFTEHLADTPRSDLVASVLPEHGTSAALSAVQTIDPALTQRFSASETSGLRSVSYGLNQSGNVIATNLTYANFAGSETIEVGATSFDRSLGRLLRYSLGAAYGHDRFPGALVAPADFHLRLSGHASGPTVRGPLGTSLNLDYDLTSTTYDYGHQSLAAGPLLSVNRAYSSHLYLNASAQFLSLDERYANPTDAALALSLPQPGVPYIAPDGTPYTGYFAYAGLSIERTYTIGVTATPNADRSATMTLQYARDFPQFHGLGRPPLTASLFLRARIAPTLIMQFGRSYTFGWGGVYLSPAYTLQFIPS